MNIRLKNIFISCLLVTLYSLLFFQPNKYYPVEILKGYEIIEPSFKEGFSAAFGLNISNIFVFLSFLLFIRDLIRNQRKTYKSIMKHFWLIFLSASGFFLVGQMSSSRFSPFFGLSIVWLMQYLQLFLVAFLLNYFFIIYIQKKSYIYSLLCVMILFESFLGGWQYIKQSYAGLSIETATGNTFDRGPEENNATFRVSGTFLYHNELGFITGLLVSLILPLIITGKSPIYKFSAIAGLIVILFTQSRSIWLSMSIILIAFIRQHQYEIFRKLNRQTIRRALIFILCSAPLVSFALVPRVLLSFNAATVGGSITLREKFFSEAAEIFIQNPWFGYGIGTNEYMLHSFFPQGVTAIFPAAVHNAFIQITLEVGLIGLLFLILPFILLFRNTVNGSKIVSSNKKDIRSAYLFGCLNVLCYYAFQPHVGIIEFPFLGILLGVGLVAAV